MGLFVYPTKAGFRVIEETWTPSRTSETVSPKDYPPEINLRMTYEEAKAAAKAFNKSENSKKLRASYKKMQQREGNLLNQSHLPESLINSFEDEILREYEKNKSRQKTIGQHWRAAKLLIAVLKIDYPQFYDKRFEIYNYYEKNIWSADYIKRITKMLNRWGSHCARKEKGFFEQIPRIGTVRYNAIAKKRANEKMKYVRTPAAPLDWNELDNLKSTFENADLIRQWNWMFIGLWFGLRPAEIDLLDNPQSATTFKIIDDKKHNIKALFIYQTKLTHVAENKRGKIIPIHFKEQKTALEMILAGNFKRPLNKTLQSYFKTKDVTTYSPRKAFTDLMLQKGFELVDISTFLGHSSIETIWRHYKDKFSYILPKENPSHLKAVPE